MDTNIAMITIGALSIGYVICHINTKKEFKTKSCQQLKTKFENESDNFYLVVGIVAAVLLMAGFYGLTIN